MRIIIAGGRTFDNIDQMMLVMDTFIEEREEQLSDGQKITIISGTAHGADSLGERYAELRGYDVEQYPAQWIVYGRSAGYKRNEQMGNVATHCVVFWDGESRGSKHMIDIANQLGLSPYVAHY